MITPVATSTLELIWDKLSINDMERLEKVKSRFLKRAIGAGKYAPSRMIYMLTREAFFLEVLRCSMLLYQPQPRTTEY
ncbi:hypothetical protein C0J52_06089 [Blattella germanica]|nr:hypothetical protein C0J52_06089 [Blattella germanica]